MSSSQFFLDLKKWLKCLLLTAIRMNLQISTIVIHYHATTAILYTLSNI